MALVPLGGIPQEQRGTDYKGIRFFTGDVGILGNSGSGPGSPAGSRSEDPGFFFLFFFLFSFFLGSTR